MHTTYVGCQQVANTTTCLLYVRQAVAKEIMEKARDFLCHEHAQKLQIHQEFG